MMEALASLGWMRDTHTHKKTRLQHALAIATNNRAHAYTYCVCMHACMYVYVHVCMYVCIYIYIYIYIMHTRNPQTHTFAIRNTYLHTLARTYLKNNLDDFALREGIFGSWIIRPQKR
jgi:hypothetical protein